MSTSSPAPPSSATPAEPTAAALTVATEPMPCPLALTVNNASIAGVAVATVASDRVSETTPSFNWITSIAVTVVVPSVTDTVLARES